VNVAYLLSALDPDHGHHGQADTERLRADDMALVARIRDGDESAFERLYQLYHAPMWDVAYRYVHERDGAEDIVHDVFRMLWERRVVLTINGSLATYLLGAVRHRALNVLRHAGVVRRATESFNEDDVPALGTASPDTDARVITHDLEAQVMRYISALPPRTQTLVILRWRHHRSYSEVAAALGMSTEAAKKLGQRVQQVLRPLLEELRLEELRSE
jgi:RNA polymerase sigma-70 factor (ECF subfamily)